MNSATGPREAPAFDPGERASHSIDFADRSAATDQQLISGAQIGKRRDFLRETPRMARDQHDVEIVLLLDLAVEREIQHAADQRKHHQRRSGEGKAAGDDAR